MGKASRSKGTPEHAAEMARRQTERNLRAANTERQGPAPKRGPEKPTTTDVVAVRKNKQRADRRRLRRLEEAAATAMGKVD